MRIAIGTDHRGYALKNYLLTQTSIANVHITWIDFGAATSERTDYPIFAERVCHALLAQEADKGILLCGTGIGMAIAANRFPGIFAAVVWSQDVAQLSASDDNANVLSLPADYVSNEEALRIIEGWLTTAFKGGRYQERVEMIENLRTSIR